MDKAVRDHDTANFARGEKAAIEKAAKRKIVAYDRYLRGKKLFQRSTFDPRRIEQTRHAIRLLDQAVAHDPAFLLAYCQLARAHEQLYFAGVDHSPDRLRLASEARDKALRLGPNRGESHLTAADIHYRCYRDYQAALAGLAIAQRGLPNDPAVFALAGFIFRRQGRWQESISNFERAAELDPRNWFLLQQTAGAYQQLRRFPDSARTLDRALAALPGDANTRVARALIDLEWHADTQPGYDALQDVVSTDPSAVDEIAEQWFYLALCRRDFAEVTRALASVAPEGIIPVNVRMPRHFCEGLAARAQYDVATAERAFTAAGAGIECVLTGHT